MPGTAGPLLEEIRRKGAADAAARVAAARAEADSIRASASDAARRRRESAVTAHQRAAATALSRTRAEAAARVGRETLAARAAALDRVFAQAERSFGSLVSNPGLKDVLAAAIGEGLSYMPSGTAAIHCSGEMADAVRSALAAGGLSDVQVCVDDGMPAGVSIEASDGSVIVDATFCRRLARERARLSAGLARRLVEKQE